MSKISIIVASEKLDKLYPAINLAGTAAISGWEAELFFTFWGLLALKKGYEPSDVSLDYKQYGAKLSEALASGSMPSWRSVLERARATGKLKVYACSTTYELLGFKEDNLESFVDDVVGAATFLGKAKDSDITLFVS
ncbi:MAG: DsrE/DsrF/DrsH-like family protein [Nitrososphaeria archaeon]